jgi:hypothetical protein
VLLAPSIILKQFVHCFPQELQDDAALEETEQAIEQQEEQQYEQLEQVEQQRGFGMYGKLPELLAASAQVIRGCERRLVQEPMLASTWACTTFESVLLLFGTHSVNAATAVATTCSWSSQEKDRHDWPC